MRRVRLILLLSFVSLPAVSQYAVGKVVFKNPGTYLQADLESVVGMHHGQKFSTEDLQAAAQRLVDTGYFEDVGVEVEGDAAAIQVKFSLKPFDAAHLTAVGFENFVWLTPDELTATLRSAAPLFHGALPDAGTQADTINSALMAALTAKGLSAVVTHVTLEPSTSQPTRAIEFRVEKPVVRVRNISLQGVSPDMGAAIDRIAVKLKGTRYNEGLAGETTQGDLLSPYNEAGFLDAKLADTHYTLSAAGEGIVEVDVAARVSEGAPYHVASIAFAGTPVVAATELAAAAKLHPGDIASHKLLMATLQPVDAAYRRMGYMDVVVQPGTVFDTAAHTVVYNVTVVPGEQYRLRSVNAIGLDLEARTEFDHGWLMRAGEIYNVEYVTGFLKNNTALRGLADNYSFAYKASADPQTHLVDLTLTFVRSGGGRR